MIIPIPILACLVLALLIESGRRGRRSRWSNRTQYRSSNERLPHRPHLRGRGWRRSEEEARRLAINLLGGTGDPTAHLIAGVVLLPGERSWDVARTRVAVWTQRPLWVTRSRIGWRGRTVRSVRQHETAAGWQDRGTIDGLVSSERLVGRIGPTGELVSVWWSTIAGIDIDLRRARILLQTNNGWRAQLSGPGVRTVAVAAVAACHGLRALTAHPGLASLWASGFPQPPSRPTPKALGPGSTSDYWS